MPVVGPIWRIYRFEILSMVALVGGAASVLFVLGMTALVGAVIGRQLPAMLVSTLLALGLVLWLGDVFPYGAATRWMPESTPRAMADYDVALAWRDDDGRILTPDDIRAIAPYEDLGMAHRWADDEFERVVAVLRGPQLTEVEVRETLITAGVAVLAIGGTLVVVSRRRPY